MTNKCDNLIMINSYNNLTERNNMTNQNEVSKSIENPIENDLRIFVQEMVVSTKAEQITANKQGIDLRNLLCDYMEQDKTNLAENGWTSKILRGIVYKLADYEVKIDKETQQRIANKIFENRVGRAIKDAVLLFYAVNPITKEKDSSIGYQVNDNGEMCLPYNVLVPEVNDEVLLLKGIKQKVPNPESKLIKITQELRENHFADVFPEGTRQSSSGQGSTDYIQMANNLNLYISGLNDTQIFDVDEQDAKVYQTLENTLNKFFEKKSSLQTTKEGNVINTSTKLVEKTGTDK